MHLVYVGFCWFQNLSKLYLIFKLLQYVSQLHPPKKACGAHDEFGGVDGP